MCTMDAILTSGKVSLCGIDAARFATGRSARQTHSVE